MKMKKIITVFLVLVFTLLPLCAKQLCVQIIQHDGTEEKIIEQSFIVEDELFNGFFNKGYIVTNSPSSVSSSDSQDEILKKVGLTDARDGLSDYFIQIKLYFEQGKLLYGRDDGLIKVKWEIYSVSNGNKIKESTIENLNKLKNNDEIRSISYDLFADLYSVIR